MGGSGTHESVGLRNQSKPRWIPPLRQERSLLGLTHVSHLWPCFQFVQVQAGVASTRLSRRSSSSRPSTVVTVTISTRAENCTEPIRP